MIKNQFNKMFIIAIATTIFGQVYMNPFGTDFRISIGIVVLALLLVRFEDTPIFRTTLMTGFVVVVFRILLGVASGGVGLELLRVHFPAFFFYLTYGMLFKLLNIREAVKQPVLLVTYISITDVTANLVEALVRYEFNRSSVEVVFTSILFAGAIRGLIVLILNVLLLFYNVVLLKDENNHRIKEFLLLASKMRSGSFFLKKSMNDVEKAMSKSYYLYSKLTHRDNEAFSSEDIRLFREEILELTNEIHEVKKDNERIIAGLEKIIPADIHMDRIPLMEIIEILVENTDSLAVVQQKEIDIRTWIKDKKILVGDYYPLITILINLLSNSVDAVKRKGTIGITQIEDQDCLILDIMDTGEGIKNSKKNIVFSPGYSTKYDMKTGQMSSGVGLTHVKALVEDFYGGTIHLRENQPGNTVFRVAIKKDRLQGGQPYENLSD